jgi:hypothetical protein
LLKVENGNSNCGAAKAAPPRTESSVRGDKCMITRICQVQNPRKRKESIGFICLTRSLPGEAPRLACSLSRQETEKYRIPRITLKRNIWEAIAIPRRGADGSGRYFVDLRTIPMSPRKPILGQMRSNGRCTWTSTPVRPPVLDPCMVRSSILNTT